jgi:hypothetical protein
MSPGIDAAWSTPQSLVRAGPGWTRDPGGYLAYPPRGSDGLLELLPAGKPVATSECSLGICKTPSWPVFQKIKVWSWGSLPLRERQHHITATTGHGRRLESHFVAGCVSPMNSEWH